MRSIVRWFTRPLPRVIWLLGQHSRCDGHGSDTWNCAREEALAAHLHSRKGQVSADERERLIALIEQAQREGH